MAFVNSKQDAATELIAGSDSAATEHTEEPQLKELVNQEAGLSSEIELMVVRSEIVDYTHPFNGNLQDFPSPPTCIDLLSLA